MCNTVEQPVMSRASISACPHSRQSAGPARSSTTHGRLLAAIDAITALDQALYRAAVVRFLRDVRDVESRVGVRILCEARLELLRRTTRYIPGLWTSSRSDES